MRWFLFCTLGLALTCMASAALGEQIVRIEVTSAQADAEQMARTGVLRHCGRNGGRREGIGFSTVSADAAVRSCRYYGRYRIVERGVARGARGWYAVLRYE